MKTFKKGGIHPPDMKEQTKDLPLTSFTSVPYVSIPLLQHFGNPAISVVNAGDVVAKGQLIAKADGVFSANIHSSISGKVARIDETLTPTGRRCGQIIIENDGENRLAEGIPCKRDPGELSREETIKAVEEAGIVGMGGAAFPASVKLSPPHEKPIDTVILNGVECEPYLTVDYRLMLEKAQEIIDGLKIILGTVGASKGYVGIESNKREAYEKMKSAAPENVAVELLEMKYPQGAEKQLIKALTGREVPPKKLPFDVGVVVHNVGTAWSIFRAVTECMPQIERPLTVAGDAVSKPGNYIVPVGTPIGMLLEHCGISPKVRKVILGGPMMGLAVANPAIPITKGTSGILAMKKLPRFIAGPCIRCGRCVDVCPLGGIASEMSRAVESGAVADFEHLHIFDCIECGSCAFVCPARRPLVQMVKQAKEEAAFKREMHRRQQAKKEKGKEK